MKHAWSTPALESTVEWHPDWNLGDTGFPIIGYDVNNDGRMDFIVCQGHSYGLYWEQEGPKLHPTWTKHIIDESFSQAHALLLTEASLVDRDVWPLTLLDC